MKYALLLSGGMDSTAIAWWKRPDLAITIDYGQRAASAEVQAATQVCIELGIAHEVLRVDCSALGSGDMAHAPPLAAGKTTDWWPFRNQLLITLAAMRAVTRSMSVLYIGTVKSDAGEHADATPEFLRHVDELLACQEGHLRVVAPAVDLTTTELVRLSGIPPGILAWSHSCHKADIACGNCRGCNKYLETYGELGDAYADA